MIDTFLHLTKSPSVIILVAIVMLLSGCKQAKLSVADEQMERGEFFEAAKTYQKIYRKLTKPTDKPLRGEIAYKMGTCYRRMNQSARASASYQNAIRYNYPDSMTYFWLGRSLQAEGKYAPAIKAYESFLEWQPNNVRARKGLLGSRMALEAKQNKKGHAIPSRMPLFSIPVALTLRLCILTKVLTNYISPLPMRK